MYCMRAAVLTHKRGSRPFWLFKSSSIVNSTVSDQLTTASIGHAHCCQIIWTCLLGTLATKKLKHRHNSSCLSDTMSTSVQRLLFWVQAHAEMVLVRVAFPEYGYGFLSLAYSQAGSLSDLNNMCHSMAASHLRELREGRLAADSPVIK